MVAQAAGGIVGAENDQRAAARAFNLARGRPVGDVAETLESLEVATIESLSPPERAQMREDIKAAEQGQKAAVANGILAQQRDTPTLELFGSLSTFGRAYDLGPTLVDSFHTDRPTAAIGLRFSTPLNFNLKDQSIEGWKKEKAGAEMSYQRKVFEQDQHWLDLLERFKESKKKFALTRAMEQGQSKKLFYEKGRLNRGRTTTFQVLLFEQDYAQAQLALIQSELEIIQIMSQMRLYGGSA